MIYDVRSSVQSSEAGTSELTRMSHVHRDMSQRIAQLQLQLNNQQQCAQSDGEDGL